MAKKDKYNKLKPTVSPITLIVVALVFIGMILTIVLSIDTAKQKFDKVNELDKNIYSLVSFKKAEKEINKGGNVLIVLTVPSEESPKELLNHLLNAYNQEDVYEDKGLTSIKGEIQKIYYVTLTGKEKENTAVTEFYEKHDEIKNQGAYPLVLAFKDAKFVEQYKDVKKPEEIVPEKLMITNMIDFYKRLAVAFESKK